MFRRVFRRREEKLLDAAGKKGQRDGVRHGQAYVEKNWERRREIFTAMAQRDPRFEASIPIPDPDEALDRSLFPERVEWMAACERYGFGFSEGFKSEASAVLRGCGRDTGRRLLIARVRMAAGRTTPHRLAG